MSCLSISDIKFAVNGILYEVSSSFSFSSGRFFPLILWKFNACSVAFSTAMGYTTFISPF